MQTIMRPEFPDTPLDGAILKDISGLWLAWHRNAGRWHVFPRRSFHRAQAHLWGIPRPEIEGYRKQIAQRAARELPGSSVELSDPDTLTITSAWSDVSQSSVLASLVGLFVAEEFDGMRLTLRVTAGDWRDTPSGRPLKEGTLVITTELREGAPRLKAVWAGELSGRGETPFWFAASEGESEFRKAVEEFRESGEAPPGSGGMFISPGRQQLRRAWRWLIFDVAEQRTLAAFLGRVTFFAIAAALCLAAASVLGSTHLTGLSMFPLAGLTLTIKKKAQNIVSRYRTMKAALQRVYSRPQKFLPFDISAAGHWPEVSACKYTRELEHLGLAHCRDIRNAAVLGDTSCQRVFVLPAERIYVFLNLQSGGPKSRNFPVKAWCVSTTYFADGSRLLVTSEGGGYRKSRNPRAIQRFYTEAADPAALLEMHRATTRKLIAEGKDLARLMSPDELLTRIEADVDRVGELNRRIGYFTWGAAIRQSFNLIRREYRARP